MKYDCGLVGNEFCVARDKEHHYLIKFTLVDGKWVMGNKRNVIMIDEYYEKTKIVMTMGYYEDAPVLKMKIREELLKQLMDYVRSK